MVSDSRDNLSKTGLITDTTQPTRRYIWEHYHAQAVLILFGSIAVAVVMFFSGELSFLAVFPLFIPVWCYRAVRRKMQQEFMRQFAEANHFSFSDTGSFAAEKGCVFRRGTNQHLYNVVAGKFRTYPLRLFNYAYTDEERSGKRQTTFYYTVCDLEFKMNMPRLYLDAHKYSSSEFLFFQQLDQNYFNSAGSLVNGLERLHMESTEFDSHFSLYITPGSQLVALQIFTPDLMSELVDLPGKYDIEIVGNQIYVYADGEITNQKNLQELFGVANHILVNVSREVERMRM